MGEVVLRSDDLSKLKYYVKLLKLISVSQGKLIEKKNKFSDS